MTEPKASGRVARLVRGAGYLGRGFRFALKHPSLWPWLAAPALVTTAVTVSGGMAAWRFGRDWLDGHPTGQGWLAAILTALLVVLVLGAGYVAFVIASAVATAPFAGFLSERTEKLSRGKAVGPSGIAAALAEMVRGVVHTVLTMSIYALLAGTLLIVHWVVTPVAPFVWAAGLLVSALFLAYDACDQPLSRRGAGFGAKWRWIFSHLSESLGFGTVVALCVLVPGLGLVILPLSTVGGTLLYLDVEGAKA